MKIEKVGEDGAGICGKKKILKAYPGDRVVARRAGKYWYVEKLLQPGEHRVEPRCSHFEECNACIWQAMKYRSQLAFKEALVKELFDNAEEIAPSPRIWHYRNKMELVFLNGNLGYRAFGRWDRAFDLRECWIAMEWMPEIAKAVRKKWRELKIPEYDLRKHRGFLRYLVLKGTRKEKLVAVVATSGLGKENAETLLQGLDVDSKFLVVNDTKSDVASGTPVHLEGKETIREKYCGFEFLFGPLSFMQPNPWQAERLYGFVRESAELRGSEKVMELYGGVGVMGLMLAEEAKKVVSVEENREASVLARKNAELNGVRNFEALNAKAEDVEIEADVLVVDPPRAGLHTSVIRKILANPPKKIVYVSCNPKTAWRDVQLLNYRVEIVKPFDMLPHTPHIELVLVLSW